MQIKIFYSSLKNERNVGEKLPSSELNTFPCNFDLFLSFTKVEIMCILQSLDLMFYIHLSDQISHGMSLSKAIWHYVAKLQMHFLIISVFSVTDKR